MSRRTVVVATLALLGWGCGDESGSGGLADIGSDVAGDVAEDVDSSADTAQPSLVLTAVQPSAAVPGEQVSVVGAGFNAELDVALRVNGSLVSFSDITVESAARLTARVPEVAAGRYDLELVAPGGLSALLADGFEVVAADEPRVDWAILQFPAEYTAAPGETFSAFAQVFEADVTPGIGQGQGLLVEVGVGDPAAELGSWIWTPAAFNLDVGADNNDEYTADIIAPAVGIYAYAFRAKLVAGGPWLYADTNGSDDGFDVGAAGVLTVVEPAPAEVDWCILQFPAAITAAPSGPVGDIFARVYEAGVTDAATGGSSELVVEVGIDGSGGEAALEGWTWASAEFASDIGNDDEYVATFAAPAAVGDYRYAYRVRLAAGSDWLYCDSTGSGDGFALSDAGTLTVEEPAPAEVDWATLRPEALVWTTDMPAPAVELAVFEAGVTTGAGQGAGLMVEVGVGPADGDPAVDASAFAYAAATYDGDEAGLAALDNDRYVAVLPALAVGSYRVVGRVSLDGGTSWLLVDTNGTADGFSADAATALEVAEPTPATVDWCQLTSPAVLSVLPGGSTSVGAEVYALGLTEAAGAGAVVGEAGVGPAGVDPTDGAWDWAVAGYSGDVGNNDAFDADIVAPAAPGAYDVAYRFRLSGETAWRFCDRDGSDNGFTSAEATQLVVAAAMEIDDVVVTPTSASFEPCVGGSRLFAALVTESGVTEGPGQGAGVVVELGWGPDGTEPPAGGWTFAAADYSDSESGAADRYELELPSTLAGAYAVSARASLDGGATWTYAAASASYGGTAPTVVCSGAVTLPGVSGAVQPGIGLGADVDVLLDGVTDQPGPSSGLEVEVAIGQAGSNPATWAYVAATYADESATLTGAERFAWQGAAPLVEGDYRVVARARYQGGPWLDLDADPGDPAFDANAGAVLLVETLTVDFCITQWPPTTTVAAGATTEALFGIVYEPDVTGVNGTGAGILAEVGYGPDGVAPDSATASWVWASGNFNVHKDNGFGQQTNDEYTGTLSVGVSGTYDYAWRFSIDGGVTWRYCDLAGSDTFDPSQAATLVVTSP